MWPPVKLQKPAAKFLWQGYISIFRAPAKLLSDQGANFESNIIRDFGRLILHLTMFKPMDRYNELTNTGAHDREIKYGLEGGLTKAFAWVSTCLQLYEIGHHQIQPALFDVGCQPHLLIDFYFPTIRSMKKHQCVDHYITELHEWLWEAFKEAQVQSMPEVEGQKWYYDRKANAISWEPGDLVLAKADA